MSDSGVQFLKEKDPAMGRLVDHFGKMRIKKRPANLDALAKIVISQQLSTKAASSIFRRLKEVSKNRSLTPQSIHELSAEQYKYAGVSEAKKNYLKGIADLILAEPKFFSSLRKKNDDDVLNSLTKIKGIGAWSASIFLMFHLGREDIFPSGDVSLNKAISNIYGDLEIAPKDFSMRWSPYRTLACLYLWASVDQAVLITK